MVYWVQKNLESLDEVRREYGRIGRNDSSSIYDLACMVRVADNLERSVWEMTWKRFCTYVSEMAQGMLIAGFMYLAWIGFKSMLLKQYVPHDSSLLLFSLIIGIGLGIVQTGKDDSEDDTDLKDYEV